MATSATEIFKALQARNKGGRLTKTATTTDNRPKVSFNRGGDDGINGGMRLYGIDINYKSVVWYVEKSIVWQEEHPEEVKSIEYKVVFMFYTAEEEEQAKKDKGELIASKQGVSIHNSKSFRGTIKTTDGVSGEIYTILDGKGEGEKAKEEGERNSIKVLLDHEPDTNIFTKTITLSLEEEEEEQPAEEQTEEQSEETAEE